MFVLFGISCYVSSTSTSEKMVVVLFDGKFNRLIRLIRPPSMEDCLYEPPRQDGLLVTTASICKINVSKSTLYFKKRSNYINEFIAIETHFSHFYD